jgi:formate dehydrogenase formation protein
MTGATLVAEWADLLRRRSAFGESLQPYGAILEGWGRWDADIVPLDWDAERCRAVWARGEPILAAAPPDIPREALEELLASTLEALAAVGDEAEGLRRFAEGWDDGSIAPEALLPTRGRLGSVTLQQDTGLSQESLGFLVYASLRPVLERYLAGCRAHLSGGPPAFGDIGEDGKRQLVCHACGASWPFSRLTCPYCGSRDPRDAVRLQAEESEEGYIVAACHGCRGYLKELDRRSRWNAGSALVEDWGSPHLDLVAQRSEYWRATPTLLDVGRKPE